MMDVQSLGLSQRTVTGKKVKQLRKQGILPVHMYGSGIESQVLQGSAGELRRVLPRVGANIPVSVQVEGSDDENICFVREVQRHPVTEDILHVDFIRVDVTQTISAEVPITLVGSAPATQQGGTLLQPLTSLLVEALPMDIPASVEADVSGPRRLREVHRSQRHRRRRQRYGSNRQRRVRGSRQPAAR